jgi:hypothetical protein
MGDVPETVPTELQLEAAALCCWYHCFLRRHRGLTSFKVLESLWHESKQLDVLCDIFITRAAMDEQSYHFSTSLSSTTMSDSRDLANQR